MIYVNDTHITVKRFGDNSLHLDLTPFDNATSPVVKWFYDSDDELFTFYSIVRYLQEHNAENISAYIPYLPHARMDRVKNVGDVFTLKYFSEIINSLNLSEVVVCDPHSYVSEALINNIKIESACSYINWAIDNYAKKHNIRPEEIILFYPDQGARKRYDELFLNNLSCFGIKKRNWNTGYIETLDIADKEIVRDKHVLIIDDICSYGGTLFRSALALYCADAKSIGVYITHCEDNILKGNVFLDGYVDQVYTTNSICHIKDHPQIEVFKL